MSYTFDVTNINSPAARILARYKQQDVRDYTTSQFKGYVFIDTCGHGYLCLGSDDNGYSDAIEIARRSNYSYILDGGLVYLEEDCDMTKFLHKMTAVANGYDIVDGTPVRQQVGV